MSLSFAGLVEPLRGASWLTQERARACCILLAVISLAFALGGLALSRGGMDPTGKPLGTDFLSFWAASKLALAGTPAEVYRIAAHFEAQQAVFADSPLEYAAFFYPPVFLLICLPLAALPYLVSLCVWLAATFYAYWRVCRAFLHERSAILSLALLAFPAVLINIGHGQNGFLSAALFGGGVLATRTRPVVAGVLFGCLVFKPHLAILVPVALAARGAWKAFFAAAATALGLIAVSLALFGVETWKGFFAVSPLARQALEHELVGSDKMQSVFAAVRLLHGSVSAAYCLQALAAVAACAFLVVLTRARTKPEAQGIALISGALIATPFLLDYDLTLLAIPLAWLFGEGRRTGFLPWEKIVLLAAFVLPLVSRLVAHHFGVPLAPTVLIAVFWLIMRRAFSEAPLPSRPVAHLLARFARKPAELQVPL